MAAKRHKAEEIVTKLHHVLGRDRKCLGKQTGSSLCMSARCGIGSTALRTARILRVIHVEYCPTAGFARPLTKSGQSVHGPLAEIFFARGGTRSIWPDV